MDTNDPDDKTNTLNKASSDWENQYSPMQPAQKCV